MVVVVAATSSRNLVAVVSRDEYVAEHYHFDRTIKSHKRPKPLWSAGQAVRYTGGPKPKSNDERIQSGFIWRSHTSLSSPSGQKINYPFWSSFFSRTHVATRTSNVELFVAATIQSPECLQNVLANCWVNPCSRYPVPDQRFPTCHACDPIFWFHCQETCLSLQRQFCQTESHLWSNTAS